MSITTITQNNNNSGVSQTSTKKGLNVNIDNVQKVDQLLKVLAAQTSIRSASSEEGMNFYTKATSGDLLKLRTDSGSGLDLPEVEEVEAPRELQFDNYGGVQNSFIRQLMDEVGLDDGENVEVGSDGEDGDGLYINQLSSQSYNIYDPSKEKGFSEATTPKLEDQEQEFPVSPTVFIVQPNGIVSTGKVIYP